MKRSIAYAILSLCISWCNLTAAQGWVNTIGSDEGIAISGFDSVAFFNKKEAVPGRKEFSAEWAGATWLFSTPENLALFKQDPEKWAPQFGGHCSLGVSNGYISKKPTSGFFDLKDGKLYLFPHGNTNQNGAYIDWRRNVHFGVIDSAKNWPQLKASLEMATK